MPMPVAEEEGRLCARCTKSHMRLGVVGEVMQLRSSRSALWTRLLGGWGSTERVAGTVDHEHIGHQGDTWRSRIIISRESRLSVCR